MMCIVDIIAYFLLLTVAKDANPQLRKLAWSPDCSMLAVAHSNGVVSLYDLLGSNIFNIYPVSVFIHFNLRFLKINFSS